MPGSHVPHVGALHPVHRAHGGELGYIGFNWGYADVDLELVVRKTGVEKSYIGIPWRGRSR